MLGLKFPLATKIPLILYKGHFRLLSKMLLPSTMKLVLALQFAVH